MRVYFDKTHIFLCCWASVCSFSFHCAWAFFFFLPKTLFLKKHIFLYFEWIILSYIPHPLVQIFLNRKKLIIDLWGTYLSPSHFRQRNTECLWSSALRPCSRLHSLDINRKIGSVAAAFGLAALCLNVLNWKCGGSSENISWVNPQNWLGDIEKRWDGWDASSCLP